MLKHAIQVAKWEIVKEFKALKRSIDDMTPLERSIASSL
jgi:hypothetical protein